MPFRIYGFSVRAISHRWRYRDRVVNVVVPAIVSRMLRGTSLHESRIR